MLEQRKEKGVEMPQKYIHNKSYWHTPLRIAPHKIANVIPQMTYETKSSSSYSLK